MSKRHQTWGIVGLIAAITLFLFAPIFRGQVPLPVSSLSPLMTNFSAQTPTSVFRDALVQAYPYHVFTSQAIHQGHFPLWNNLIFAGIPFFANGQAAVLSPLKALWWWLPPAASFTLTMVLQLMVAGLGMYILTRSWRWSRSASVLSAAVFMLSGPMVLWSPAVVMGSVVAWLPWILWAIHRVHQTVSWKWVAILSSLVAGMLFSGQIQIAFLVGLFSGVWALVFWEKFQWRRRVILFGSSLLLSLGLSAILLIPTWEATQQAYRQPAPATWSQVLRVRQLLSFNQRNARALVTLVSPVALGSESDYRGPANFIEGNIFIGPLALVLCLASLSWWRRKIWRVAAAGAVLVGLFILFPGWWVVVGKILPWLSLTPVWRLSFFLVFCLAILAGLGAQSLWSKLPARLAPWSILVVAALSLWQWQHILPFGPSASLYAPSTLLQQAASVPGRVWTPDSGLDQFMPYGVAIVGGYDSLYPRSYLELWQANSQVTKKNQLVARDLDPNLLPVLGATRMITKGPVPDGWRVIGVDHGFSLAVKNDPLGPWRTVQQTVVRSSAKVDGIDPRRQVFSDEPTGNMPNDASTNVQVISSSQMHAKVEVQTTANTLLVTPLQWYPGWRATVDGHRVGMKRVNHAFIGVAIPSGLHQVVLAYQPKSVTIGAIISAVGFLVTVFLFFREWFSRQRHNAG